MPTNGRHTRPVTPRQTAALTALHAATTPQAAWQVAQTTGTSVDAARAALEALERKHLARHDYGPGRGTREARVYELTPAGRAVREQLAGGRAPTQGPQVRPAGQLANPEP